MNNKKIKSDKVQLTTSKNNGEKSDESTHENKNCKDPVESPADRVIIYTDGSCVPNPGKGGWAFIAVLEDVDIVGYNTSNNTTNNIMELTAVIEALNAFPDKKYFYIYSDSTYVINCARGIWKRKKNIDLWRKYDEAVGEKDVIFEWVKGHSGDIYNDKVDRLARTQKL